MLIAVRTWAPAFRGVADQALTSAENFAIGVILVRNCTKYEFGLYGLGYGLLVLGWTLISALITSRMTADMSGMSLSLQQGRTIGGSLLHTLLVASVSAMGCGWLVVFLLFSARVIDPGDLCYWLLVCSALPALCLRDFMRRYFFQIHSESQALVMDGAALILTVFSISFMASRHAHNLHSVAAATLAAGGLAVGIAGMIGARLSPRKSGGSLSGAFKSVWRSGGWSLGATVMSWTQGQTYTFFTTAMLGLPGLATANAPRVLLTPITLLSSGLALPLLPRIAGRKSNVRSLVDVRSFIVCAVVTSFFVTVYLAALWLARGAVIPLILGDRYGDVWPCVIAWAVTNVFVNLRIYYSTFLIAKGGFRQLAGASFLGFVSVICFTQPLINHFGVLGSVYSVAAGEFILGIAIWHRCRIVAAAVEAA